MRLQQIGPDQEGSAVRQLDMGDLEFGALAAQNGKIPKSLEWASRTGMPRPDERPVARRCRALSSAAPVADHPAKSVQKLQPDRSNCLIQAGVLL